MTQRCKACLHAERAAIDVALVKGESHRTIAARHGLTKAALTRHAAAHAGAVTAAKERTEAAHERTVLEQVRELAATARAVLAAAVLAATEPAGVIEAMRELGRLLELEGKLTGAFAPKVMTLKLDSLSDEELEQRYLSALERGQKEKRETHGSS